MKEVENYFLSFFGTLGIPEMTETLEDLVKRIEDEQKEDRE